MKPGSEQTQFTPPKSAGEWYVRNSDLTSYIICFHFCQDALSENYLKNPTSQHFSLTKRAGDSTRRCGEMEVADDAPYQISFRAN
jgi:hypothetical protein